MRLKVVDLSKIKRFMPTILSIAALALFVSYLIKNFDRYEQLLDLSMHSVLWLLVLVLGTLCTNGLINFTLYRGLGADNMAFGEAIGLAAVNTLANQLPFAGGMVAKAVYLKRRYRMAYSQFVSATVVLFILSIAVEGIMGLVGLFYLTVFQGYALSGWLMLGFGLMSGALLLLWLPIDAFPIPAKWEGQVSRAKEGWQILKNNPALLLSLIAINTAGILVFAFRSRVVFRALSQDVNFAQCVLFASASVLTQLVAITPGGLGVREGIVATVASVYGIEFGVSVLAVGIDRLVATSVIIVMGTVFTYILSKKAANTPVMQGKEG